MSSYMNKLLIGVHVCLGTRTGDNWHSGGIWRVIYLQSSSCYWAVVLFCVFWCINSVVRSLHFPDCQRLKNLCKLVETIFMLWFGTIEIKLIGIMLVCLCSFQLVFSFVPRFRRQMKILWCTVSDAELKSSKIRAGPSPASAAEELVTWSRTVSVLCFVWKPDWNF